METQGKMMAATCLVLSLWSASAFPAHEVREARKLYPGSQASHTPGSYQYSYETKEHGSKSETSDKDGNVVGTFSYMDIDGSIRSVKYKAGANIGFVIISDVMDHSLQAQQQQSETRLHCSVVSQEALLPIPGHMGTAGHISGPIASGDSSYSFAFDTLDHSRTEMSDSSGNIQGTYTYNDGEGHTRQVDYTAGKHLGFVVTGTKIMTSDGISPSAQPQVSTDSHISQTGVNTGVGQGYRLPISPYHFDYDAGTHSHSQTADQQGQVKGEYSYVTPDGLKRTITYTVGEGTGFVITNERIEPATIPDHKDTPVKKAPVRPVNGNVIANKSPSYAAPVGQKYTPSGLDTEQTDKSEAGYSFSYNAGTHSHSENRDSAGGTEGEYSYLVPDGTMITIKYVVRGDSGFVITDEVSKPASLDEMSLLKEQYSGKKKGVYQAGKTSSQSVAPSLSSSDQSATKPYSFGYQTPTHTHSESKNDLGHVQGSYSYLTADGAYVTIDYIAGNEMGFVVTSQQQEPASSELLAILETETQRKVEHGADTHPSSADTGLLQAGRPSSDTYEAAAKPSYAFEYDVDTHSHKEESDGTGNVVGQYSTLSADGKVRTIKYSSSPSTGYNVIKDESHPAPTHLLAQLNSQPTAQLSGEKYFSSQHGNQKAQIPTDHTPLDQVPVYVEKKHKQSYNHNPVSGLPAAYSFKYDATSHSREEKLNPDGKVQGSYSYLTSEGQVKTVEYLAGGAEGFVITSEKAEQAPKELIALLMEDDGAHSTSPTPGTHSVTKTTSEDKPNSNSHYLIDYNAGSHSRKEKIDSKGIVSGEYTILTPDHKLRTIQYKAGDSIGFTVTKETVEDAPSYLPSQGNQGGYLPGISQSFTDKEVQSQTPSSFSFSYNAGSHSHRFSSGYPRPENTSHLKNTGVSSSKDQKAIISGPKRTQSTLSYPLSKHKAQASSVSTVGASPDILYKHHVLKTYHQPTANKYGYSLHLV